jgi:hypothetical protein
MAAIGFTAGAETGAIALALLPWCFFCARRRAPPDAPCVTNQLDTAGWSYCLGER